MDWNDIVRLDKEGRLPRLEGSADAPHMIAAPTVIETVLSTGDQHGRFIDVDAWGAVLRILEAVKVDRFIFNGDWTDFYDLSKYVKDPEVEGTIADDIDASKSMFRDVRKRMGDRPIHANPGNHEFRYELYLRSDAKKLSGLQILKLPELMDAKKYGITFHKKDGFELAPGFRVYHGEVVRKHAGESAKGEFLNWGCSGTSQHVHRLAIHRVTNNGGDHTWSEGGCLCHLDPEYVTRKPNWQHGCILILRMSDGTIRQHEVRIVNGVVQGPMGMMIGDISF